MKKYTVEDIKNFEKNKEGYTLYPRGDYTEIKSFDKMCCFGYSCIFGKNCSFSEKCSFSENCSFGEGCSFSENCNFGKNCSFSEWCSFGELCSFGKMCRFGEICSFGEMSNFGEECIFGKNCSFGEKCRFGENCNFENERIKNGMYFACDRIGSTYRKTYFFCNEDKDIFVRAGCFFGTEKEFLKELEETHGNTKYERQYILALELAKSVLLEV